MTTIDTMLTEISRLRDEIHEWRREDKSEHVRMASEITALQAWRNKQAGALTVWGTIVGLASAVLSSIGVVVVKQLTGRGGQ